MNEEQQELSTETISKYVSGLNKLSICTGKLDTIILYLKQKNIEDEFLLSSLDSILKDIININGDKQYIPMNSRYENVKVNTIQNRVRHILKPQEQTLNIKKVQTHKKENKTPTKTSETPQNENKDCLYIFKNSSNLKSIISYNAIKTRIEFQNGRLYDYFNIPENKIKTLITCDKNNISPGKYFNSEIKGQYEYREVSKDMELVG
jgi:hypothetical protein